MAHAAELGISLYTGSSVTLGFHAEHQHDV